jgi:hypothetical protein
LRSGAPNPHVHTLWRGYYYWLYVFVNIKMYASFIATQSNRLVLNSGLMLNTVISFIYMAILMPLVSLLI